MREQVDHAAHGRLIERVERRGDLELLGVFDVRERLGEVAERDLARDLLIVLDSEVAGKGKLERAEILKAELPAEAGHGRLGRAAGTGELRRGHLGRAIGVGQDEVDDALLAVEEATA